MRKNIIHKVLLVTGSLLILAALSLAGYNLREDHVAGEKAEEVLAVLLEEGSDKNSPKEKEQILEKEVSEKEAVKKESAKQEPSLYELYPDMEMPVTEVDGQRYIGWISIPDLELELPVQENWDYPKLRVTPCRYKGSVYSDDVIIVAHNYTRHFGMLHTMEQGDEVKFTDADGNVFSYKVTSVEQLPGTAIEEMEAGDWDLTLFTCTYGGESRVTVRCSKTIDTIV